MYIIELSTIKIYFLQIFMLFFELKEEKYGKNWKISGLNSLVFKCEHPLF